MFSPHENIFATFLTRFPLYGLHNHHIETRLKHILPYFYQSQPYFHHFTTFLLHLNQISTMYATLPWHSTIFLPYSIIFPPFYQIAPTHEPFFKNLTLSSHPTTFKARFQHPHHIPTSPPPSCLQTPRTPNSDQQKYDRICHAIHTFPTYIHITTHAQPNTPFSYVTSALTSVLLPP